MIIHNATVLQTEFVIVDENGEQVGRKSAEAKIFKFTSEEFQTAFTELSKVKAELEAQYQQSLKKEVPDANSKKSSNRSSK